MATRREFLASIGAAPVLARLMFEGPQSVPSPIEGPIQGKTAHVVWFDDPVDYYPVDHHQKRRERDLEKWKADWMAEWDKQVNQQTAFAKLPAPKGSFNG